MYIRDARQRDKQKVFQSLTSSETSKHWKNPVLIGAPAPIFICSLYRERISIVGYYPLRFKLDPPRIAFKAF